MAPPTDPKVPEIVLGVANVGDAKTDTLAKFDTPDEVNSFLDAFYNRGYRHIDTARVYSPNAPGSSEPRLGAVEAGRKFVIDTKVWSFNDGDHNSAGIERSIKESLEALHVDSVNIEYLHRPERTTPFEETVAAMDKWHKAGKFKKFGISNYTADETKQLIQIGKDKGYQIPQVYQGNYNPITRGVEGALFPILRENKMAFYAYSPTAGGLFSDKAKEARPGDRFDNSNFIGQMYQGLYFKPEIEALVNKARDLAKKHGIDGHAAALRWTVYHSILSGEHGDAVILGASSVKQLNANLDSIEAGPLPKDLADTITSVYDSLSEKDREMFHM